MLFWSLKNPFPSVPGPVHTVPLQPGAFVRNCTLLATSFTQTAVFFEIATDRARFRMVASSWAPAFSVAARQYETNAGALTAVMMPTTATNTSSSARLNPRLSPMERRHDRSAPTPTRPSSHSFEPVSLFRQRVKTVARRVGALMPTTFEQDGC